jgi:hypothetical protein
VMGYLRYNKLPAFVTGKVQGQDYFLLGVRSYPFINMVKTMQSLSYDSGASNGFPCVPTELDTDGYLTTTATGTASNVLFVPPSKTGPGTTWVLRWTGRGTLGIGGALLVTGSFSNLGGATTNRCTLTLPAVSDGQIRLGVSAIQTNGSDYPKGWELMLASEEGVYDAGNIVSSAFKAIFASQMGVYRFLDFQMANAGVTTTWASRKPTTFYSYYADEWRAVDKDAGRVGMAMYVTTSGGTVDNYQATVGTGGPVDKRILMVRWDRTAVGNSWTFNLNGTGAVPMKDVLFFDQATNPPTIGLTSALVYDADINTWIKYGGNPSLSSGIKNGIPPEVAVKMCIELNSHPYFIVPFLAVDPLTDWLSSLDAFIKANAPSWMIPRYEGPNESWNNFAGFYAARYIDAKATAQWGTTNDANHHWYGRVMSEIGQAISTSRAGDRTKYQVLCGVQSAGYGIATTQNPRLNSPRGRTFRAATFTNASANVSVPGNTYALNAPLAIIAVSSADNYPTGTGITNAAQQTFYVKTTGATITLSLTPGGAAIVFGTSNQTVFNLTPGASPAYNWVTTVCCTGYSNPSAQNQLSELKDGWNYLVNGTASLITNYAATSTITDNSLKASYVAWYNWANSFSVAMKLCQYEGGWSPDYIPFVNNCLNAITAVTKTTAGNFNTVITLADTNYNGNTRTGHAFAIGMPLCGLNVTTMTQLNSLTTNVTFGIGSPGIVNWGSAHGFALNQPVTFGAGGLRFDNSFDCPVTPGIVYYVKDNAPGGNNTRFTVSATAGGAAIDFSFTNSRNCSASACWVVTAVTATTVTINCDSSGFTAFGAGSGNATYGCYGGSNGGTGSAAMINVIRNKSKEEATLRSQTKKNYDDFIASGGEFPSIYLLAGSAQAWSVWDPDVYRGTTPPQWLGVQDFNG